MAKEKTKTIRLRCWIDIDGKKFFGPGPYELLSLIEEHGSITEASRKMEMSYKKAWDLVSNLNKKGKTPFVNLQKGGDKGGGASLTPTGKKVIKEYQVLTKKLNTVLEGHPDILKWI